MSRTESDGRAWARLARNATANYAGQLTTVGVAFLLTPFLLSGLGPSMYGVWVLVVSIQGLGGLLDLGITAGVVKYVAQHDALGESDERNRVLSTTFLVHIGLGLVAFGVMGLIAWLVLPFLNLRPAELNEGRSALLVAGAGLWVALPLSVPGNLLIGLRRYEVSNLVSIIQALVAALATLVALTRGVGPAGLIAINSAIVVLGYAVKWAYAARVLPDLHIEPSLASRATLRRVGGYSGWLFLVNSGTALFYNADAVLIAAFLPVRAVGTYNIGFKPASAVSYFAGPLVSVFVPAASGMDARRDAPGLQRLLIDGTRAAMVLTLIGSVWLWAFGGQLVELWVGPGHSDSLPILWIFVGVFAVSAFQNPSSAILRGIGEVRSFALVVLVEYGANLVLSALLIPRVGITGAAVGTLLPAFVIDLFIIPWLACRALGSDYRMFLLRTVPGCAAAAALTLAVLFPLSRFLSPASILGVAVGGLCAALVFAGSFMVLGLDRNERRALLARLRGPAERPAGPGSSGA
jgi:O-antigen/teichoic acid export membrane protein